MAVPLAAAGAALFGGEPHDAGLSAAGQGHREHTSAVPNKAGAMGELFDETDRHCCGPTKPIALQVHPLLHLMGYTPKSPTLEDAFKGNMPKNPSGVHVTMDDVVEMFRHINNIAPAPGPEKAKPVDVVIIGCPHATFEEVREVARLVKGRKVKEGVMLWMQTDTPSYHMAHQYGDAQIIEEAGGKIYHQTCMMMNPARHYPKPMTVATDSFKYIKLGGGMGQQWIFGNPPALSTRRLPACLRRARVGITGPSRGMSGWPAKRSARFTACPS